MRSILIQKVYPNKGRFLKLIQENFVRNTDYCEKFGFDYMFVSSEMFPLADGGWDKIVHVQQNLSYDFIVWLDADALIFDTNRDLRDVPTPQDSIGAVRFLMPVPHLNVGVMYIRTGPRVKNFIEDWLSDYPGLGAWRDQAVFNTIRNDCVVEIPKEWNKNYDNNPYAKPVVMGFHGFGDAEKRLLLMRKALEHGLDNEQSSLRRHAG